MIHSTCRNTVIGIFLRALYNILITFADMGEAITIHTDGAARGNPGPGGYGIVMRYKGHEKTMAEGYKKTTNNRMELLAVIVALEQLKTKQIPVRIYTDSKYVADAVEQGWIHNRERKQFRKTKNPDLWRRFLSIYKQIPDIRFHWVKGHANNELNNRADELAVAASKLPTLKIDEGYQNNNEELF